MFYPIPSLENKYEINKKGVVRNAKTKHILKPVSRSGKQFIFSLNGKQVSRNVEVLIAELFDKEGNYLPIPSLNGKYEINKYGIVRNSKTKKRLSPFKRGGESLVVSVKINGKDTHRSIPQLLWEVHGALPKKVWFLPPVAVTIQKGVEHYSFESIKKCAKFLSAKEYYSFSWVCHQLFKRKENIYGWKIFYQRQEQADISRPSQFVNRRKMKNENN